MIVAHPRKVCQCARLQGEPVFLLPSAFGHNFQVEHGISGCQRYHTSCQTIDTPIFWLLHAGLEAQWFQKAIAEADVGQPGLFEIDTESEVVEFGAVSTVVASDSTRERRYPETKRSQQGGKTSIQFVAKTAAFFVHDLVQNAAFVTDNFSSQVDIKIFERNCEEVHAVEGAQEVNVRRQRPLVVNAP